VLDRAGEDDLIGFGAGGSIHSFFGSSPELT
jgi:hypothetical protein